MKAKDLNEAIKLVNSTRYGNALSIFTSDGKNVRIFCKRVKLEILVLI